MMLNVKDRAEQYLQREITQVVSGRPVNFQGTNAQDSSRHAQVMWAAADKRVLVVDVAVAPLTVR